MSFAMARHCSIRAAFFALGFRVRTFVGNNDSERHGRKLRHVRFCTVNLSTPQSSRRAKMSKRWTKKWTKNGQAPANMDWKDGQAAEK